MTEQIPNTIPAQNGKFVVPPLGGPLPPIQRQMDLRLRIRCPLVCVKTAKDVLKRTEEEIEMLVENGFLLWAFDIARLHAKYRRELRILRKSIEDYENGVLPQEGWRDLRAEPATKKEWQDCLKEIIPAQRAYRAWELAQIFNCSKTHINSLVDDGTLVEAQPRRHKKESPLITRASIVDFLKAKRQ